MFVVFYPIWNKVFQSFIIETCFKTTNFKLQPNLKYYKYPILFVNIFIKTSLTVNNFINIFTLLNMLSFDKFLMVNKDVCWTLETKKNFMKVS